MLQILGLEENLKNVFLFAEQKLETRVPDFKSLQKAYRKQLKTIQTHLEIVNNPEPTVLSDPTKIKNLTHIFNQDTLLNDLDNKIQFEDFKYIYQNAHLVSNRVDSFLRYYPGYSSLFKLVIHSIFTARSKQAGGGTTSDAIGVIWCDPRDTWTEQDMMEFFIH